MSIADQILKEVEQGAKAADLAGKYNWDNIPGADRERLFEESSRAIELLKTIDAMPPRDDHWRRVRICAIGVYHPEVPAENRRKWLKSMLENLNFVSKSRMTETQVKVYSLNRATYYALEGKVAADEGNSDGARQQYRAAFELYEKTGETKHAKAMEEQIQSIEKLERQQGTMLPLKALRSMRLELQETVDRLKSDAERIERDKATSAFALQELKSQEAVLTSETQRLDAEHQRLTQQLSDMRPYLEFFLTLPKATTVPLWVEIIRLALQEGKLDELALRALERLSRTAPEHAMPLLQEAVLRSEALLPVDPSIFQATAGSWLAALAKAKTLMDRDPKRPRISLLRRGIFFVASAAKRHRMPERPCWRPLACPQARSVVKHLEDGLLASIEADKLLDKGVPWPVVAPFVHAQDWWSRQRARQATPLTKACSAKAWEAGLCLHLPEAVVWIDPGPCCPQPVELHYEDKPDLIVVTHAHADHTEQLAAYSEAFPDIPVIMSPATAVLLSFEARSNTSLGVCLRSRVTKLALERSVNLVNLSIRLLPAGHLLGAAMLEIMSEAGDILVTGDFALRDVGGLGGAVWPDRSYGLVLQESTGQGDLFSLPYADAPYTRMALLAQIDAVMANGDTRIVIPAQAKGEAQEIYAALILAQQAGRYPDLEVRFSGHAAEVADEYYRALNGIESVWACQFLKASVEFIPDKSLVIWSKGAHGDDSRSIFGDMVSNEKGGPSVLDGLPVYTHAGWGERMALAAGVACDELIFYNGIGPSSLLSSIGRRHRSLPTLSTRGQ